jgi:hypothetical protein
VGKRSPTSTPLTADGSIGEWPARSEGKAALSGLLTEFGVGEQPFAPIHNVSSSARGLSQDVVDDLVRQVNGVVIPEAAAVSRWRERVVAGRFADRTVIVTGAASGIGRATASRIAREGGRVVGVDVSAAGLKDPAAELSGNDFVPVTADLTRVDDIARIIGAAGPRIYGLANDAGIGDDFSLIHEVSDKCWDRVFAVNVNGLFRLTRAVVSTGSTSPVRRDHHRASADRPRAGAGVTPGPSA